MTKEFTEITRLHTLLRSYATKTFVDIDNDSISEKDCLALFTLIVRDYVNGIVSVDDLSALCEMVYGKLKLGSELYSLLLMGAEIEWYIRHDPQKAANAIEDILGHFTKEVTQ